MLLISFAVQDAFTMHVDAWSGYAMEALALLAFLPFLVSNPNLALAFLLIGLLALALTYRMLLRVASRLDVEVFGIALLTAPPVALLALAFFSTYSIARSWLHRRMPGYFPALPYFAACWFLSLFLALSTFAVL